MDMIVVDGRKVLECAHCKGSTLCACSLLVEADRAHGDRKLVPLCSRCGTGVARHSPFRGELKEWRPPICQVCEGKGFLVV